LRFILPRQEFVEPHDENAGVKTLSRFPFGERLLSE